MHILSLTRENSLPLESRKKTKTTKKTEKFSRIKYILFLILHMISNLYSIWTTNKNTVVSHRKENSIENGKQRIFFLHFVLQSCSFHHYALLYAFW